MQDIHALGGVGGGGGGGGGGGPLFGVVDRRLRALNQQQPLKCPRCESLNTKFCYYNNYNLSQPRHFCKACRRYWTKGGVLRNVPVGGGCRKAKRSNKPKQQLTTSASASAAAAPPAKTNSHSSSESSSLTTTTAAAAAGEAVSGGCGSGSSSNSAVPPPLFSYPPESSFFVNPGAPSNLNFNPSAVDGGSIFPEMGSFTGLMTASNDQTALGFNMGDISNYGLENENEGVGNQNQEMQYMGDQTAEIEYSGNRISHGGVASVDWHQAADHDHDIHIKDQDEDQGMFDLTGSVDWSQQITQWPHHHHHSLHFLP